MEPTLELACSIYDKNQDFLGETDVFFRLEFLIFFAQIIAMPFCVIRMKIGKLIEIDDVHFQQVMTQIEYKIKGKGKDKMKIRLQGYEIDVWPNGLKVDGRAQSFRSDHLTYPYKEWLKGMTRLHAGAIDKYICQQVNQVDILEIGSMNA